jgi:hypothetical protein
MVKLLCDACQANKKYSLHVGQLIFYSLGANRSNRSLLLTSLSWSLVQVMPETNPAFHLTAGKRSIWWLPTFHRPYHHWSIVTSVGAWPQSDGQQLPLMSLTNSHSSRRTIAAVDHMRELLHIELLLLTVRCFKLQGKISEKGQLKIIPKSIDGKQIKACNRAQCSDNVKSMSKICTQFEVKLAYFVLSISTAFLKKFLICISIYLFIWAILTYVALHFR